MVGYPCCSGFMWVPVSFPWASQNRTCPFLLSRVPGFTVSYITHGNIPWEKQLLATNHPFIIMRDSMAWVNGMSQWYESMVCLDGMTQWYGMMVWLNGMSQWYESMSDSQRESLHNLVSFILVLAEHLVLSSVYKRRFLPPFSLSFFLFSLAFPLHSLRDNYVLSLAILLVLC